jgi:hypothetical protein
MVEALDLIGCGRVRRNRKPRIARGGPVLLGQALVPAVDLALVVRHGISLLVYIRRFIEIIPIGTRESG